MRKNPPSKILTILISLFIGYAVGIGSFIYFLQRYGYPQQYPITLQPVRPQPLHQNAWLPDQIEQLRPQMSQMQQMADALPESEHGAVPPIIPESSAMIADDVRELRQRNLLLPLSNLKKENLRDSFGESRGKHLHEAIDITAPRNTAILAVEGGSIARLWFSTPGGITIYQFDQEQKYEYYYAHLERYADGLKEGDQMKRGQVIGYVGTSGNAPDNSPHLHFTIFKLTDQKQWWEGTAINPYLVYSRSD